MHIEDSRAAISTRQFLLQSGMSESRLKRALRRGELRRLRPGSFVRTDVWDAEFSEGRHLLEVVAADADRKSGDAVFSHLSAAALHGLPLFRAVPAHVHMSGGRTDAVARPRAGVARHGVEVPESDRALIDGIPCTSAERTVYDVIRTESRETALALADAAMRVVAWDERARKYDHESADAWRGGLLERIARAPGARGIRQARWIARLADGRAELPGESTSRLYLVDLGFRYPLLQVPFAGPTGEDWRIDFGLEDVRAWGEFDGLAKYSDPSMRGSLTPMQVLMEEKRREDWIRGRSQWRYARWGTRDIPDAQALGRRLAQFGIRAA